MHSLEMTLDEPGQKMGYNGDMARTSAWQFLNKTHDHRVSMLRTFAGVVGVEVVDLFKDRSPSANRHVGISCSGRSDCCVGWSLLRAALAHHARAKSGPSI
jgi:hypothetical protein